MSGWSGVLVSPQEAQLELFVCSQISRMLIVQGHPPRTLGRFEISHSIRTLRTLSRMHGIRSLPRQMAVPVQYLCHCGHNPDRARSGPSIRLLPLPLTVGHLMHDGLTIFMAELPLPGLPIE